ncbi:MAG: LuxR C-terminal-related transcriptional regulator, partial [Gaiellaceae bacterium]
VRRRLGPTLLAVGRFGAVIVPVTVVHAIFSSPPVDEASIASMGLATAVWLVTLRRAYAATRPSTFALGAPLTSALGTLLGLAAIAIIFFWLPDPRLGRQELILMSGGVFLGSVAFELFVAHRLVGPRRVAIVGATARAAQLVDDVRHSSSPFVCVGVVDDGWQQGVFERLPVLGRLADLPEIIYRQHPDLIVLVKTAHPDDVASAVRQAFDHSVFIPGAAAASAPTAADAPVRVERPGGLTPRELEILKLVAEGHSNAQLARMLWVTEQTVKFHLSNIYRKLDVANRTEASRWAQRNGLLGDELSLG